MAKYRDTLPSQLGWIHDLAKAEVHPDAERLLQLGQAFNPQQLIEENTIDFLTELRAHLDEYVRIFNSYSDGATRFAEIKIYQLAQAAADFMAFRNQIKLVFSNSAHGVIQIAFSQHGRGALGVDGSTGDAEQVQELIAEVGPFRDVYWTYRGEKVTAEQVAKFYFAEFVRVSRDMSRSRVRNQALLDQIKSLLEEKGIDLK